MTKFVTALVALAVAAGATLAAPVRFVKYDEKTKTLTVKTLKKKGVEPEDKEYKLSDKVKFTDGDDAIKYEDAVKKLTAKKPVKGFDLKADGDEVKEVKFVARKKAKSLPPN